MRQICAFVKWKVKITRLSIFKLHLCFIAKFNAKLHGGAISFNVIRRVSYVSVTDFNLMRRFSSACNQLMVKIFLFLDHCEGYFKIKKI